MDAIKDHAIYYYLAQIAFEIYRIPARIWGKTVDVTDKDFLIRFSIGDATPQATPPAAPPVQLPDKAARSKTAWAGFFAGMAIKKK